MGCGSSQTSSTTSQPPQAVLNAYQNVFGQAQNVTSQPYQAYQGPLVAGFTPAQLSAMGTINAAQGVTTPYTNQSAQLFQSAAQPITPMNFSGSTINSLMSPYINDVANATEAQMNSQNQIQQEQLMGSTVGQGAYGGDRQAVAQALLGGQQQLAETPTIANLYNTGYGTALGEFNALQQAGIGAQEASGWLQQGAGYGLANLGQEVQANALTGANAQLQSGALQQQLAQENLNIPYEQFQAQQAYPYQTTGYLANIAEGLGSGMGGTSSTTTPGPSALSQAAGLGVTGLGLYGLYNNLSSGLGALNGINAAAGASAAANAALAAAHHRGGAITRMPGGGIGIPLQPPSNMGSIPDVSVSVIPTGSGQGSASKLGAGMSPMQPVVTQTTGGGSGLMGTLGPILAVANLATHLSGGGRTGFATGGTGGAAAPAASLGSFGAGSGLPGTAPAFNFVPMPVNPSASVALPVHGAPMLGSLSMTAPSAAGPLSLAQIAPTANYAPTFNAQGYPAGMQVSAPGSFTGTPLTLPLTNGVLSRNAGYLPPAPTVTPPAATTPTPFTPDEQASLAPATGGMSRGGRMGLDQGGTAGSSSLGSPGLPQVPDLSIAIIPNVQTSGMHGGVGIPQAPHPASGQDPLQQGLSAANMASSLGKMLDKATGSARGGVIGRDLGGGSIQQAGQAATGGANPITSGLLQQYLQLPMEQLQELSVRFGSNSIYGQIIQQALNIKRMSPNMGQTGQQMGQMPMGVQTPLGGQAPQAAAVPTSAASPALTSGALAGSSYRRGGRLGFQDGGDVPAPDLGDSVGPAAVFVPPPDQNAAPAHAQPSAPAAAGADLGSVPQPHETLGTAGNAAPAMSPMAIASADLGGSAPSALNPSGGIGTGAPAETLPVMPAKYVFGDRIPRPLTDRSGNIIAYPPQTDAKGNIVGSPDYTPVQGAAVPKADLGRADVASFWESKGAKPWVAQGIADSVARESAFNPGAWNPDDVGSPSGGLYQHHAGRLNALISAAAKAGVPVDKHGLPLDPNFENKFAYSEVTGGDPLAAKHWQEILSAPDRATAQTLWDKYFERGVVQGPQGAHPSGLGAGAPGTTPGGTSANMGQPPSKADQLFNLALKYAMAPDPVKRQTAADSPWLPVVAAGLGMMASRSPFAGVAIGEGGLAGVKTAEAQQQEQSREQIAQNESENRRAMLMATLAGRQQTAEMEGQRMALTAAGLRQRGDYQGSMIADAHARLAQDAANEASLEKQRAFMMSKPMAGYTIGPDGQAILGTQQYNQATGRWDFTPGATVGHPTGQTFQDRTMAALRKEYPDMPADQLLAKLRDPNSNQSRLVEQNVETDAINAAKTELGQSFNIQTDATQQSIHRWEQHFRQEFQDHLGIPAAAPTAAPAATPTHAPGAAPAAQHWAHSATGPDGVKVYSNDGKSWFNPNGTPYEPPK